VKPAWPAVACLPREHTCDLWSGIYGFRGSVCARAMTQLIKRWLPVTSVFFFGRSRTRGFFFLEIVIPGSKSSCYGVTHVLPLVSNYRHSRGGFVNAVISNILGDNVNLIHAGSRPVSYLATLICPNLWVPIGPTTTNMFIPDTPSDQTPRVCTFLTPYWTNYNKYVHS
jgi:hypothetical protein